MRLTTDEMLKIKEYFFREGVALVEDKTTELHDDLQINSHEVMKMFKSLVSKGIARKVFVWRHAYFFITTAGIDILKEELVKEEEEMPITHVDGTNHNYNDRIENVMGKETL